VITTAIEANRLYPIRMARETPSRPGKELKSVVMFARYSSTPNRPAMRMNSTVFS